MGHRQYILSCEIIGRPSLIPRNFYPWTWQNNKRSRSLETYSTKWKNLSTVVLGTMGTFSLWFHKTRVGLMWSIQIKFFQQIIMLRCFSTPFLCKSPKLKIKYTKNCKYRKIGDYFTDNNCLWHPHYISTSKLPTIVCTRKFHMRIWKSILFVVLCPAIISTRVYWL